MLRDDVIDAIRDRTKQDKFLWPDYERYCFANIPETILSLFGTPRGRPELPEDVFDGYDTDEYDDVVLFLFDGFGYEHWTQYSREDGFFEQWTAEGRVTPLTAIFPSTTSAALTTLHTGLTPQEHAMPEWTLYYEEFGEVIQTLPFIDTEGGQLPLDPGPDVLFEGEPVYADLAAEEGVTPVVLVRDEMVGTEYSQLVFADAEVVPYMNLADMAVTLRELLEERDERLYIHVYVDYIDAAAHRDGPGGDSHRAQIETLGTVLEDQFLADVDADAVDPTLLLATADHGHVGIDPQATADLYDIDGVRDLLRVDSDGDPIQPTGSPRDLFLHAADDGTGELVSVLEDRLDAAVMRTAEAVEDGLFGLNEPTDRFLDRVGDVLVVPHDHETVWFREGDEPFELQGHHGGLSEEEMLVPFAVASLDALL